MVASCARLGPVTGAVLAIDQGTSGTKAIVVDQDDGLLAAVEVPVRPAYLPGGRVEQDPEQLLESVLEAGRQALTAAGRPVGIVSLANQGETVLAWDPLSGKPLSTAIGWQDGRAADICAQLVEHRETVARRTGLVLDPYFSAPKMTWIRRNLTAAGVVTTSDSWLVHRLTGEFVTDVSTASRSLLLDVDRVRWDSALLDLFDLSDEALPRLVDCDEIVGTTSAFGPELAVGGLIVDQQAALLAQRCWDLGAAKCTFGTGAFLLANTGRTAPRSTSGLTTSVAWRIGGGVDYCVDGQVFTVASAVRWLTDIGLISAADRIDSVVPADADGVLCVPALAGLAAPWWRPDATATFTGITLSSTAGHLVLAVLQGIAAQVAALTSSIAGDLGGPLTTLRVDGGLTRSAALMQSVADLTQLPVEVYPSQHATALGAAALGRLCGQPGLPIAQAVLDWAPSLTYQPRWTPDRAAEFRQSWQRAADHNLPDGEPS